MPIRLGPFELHERIGHGGMGEVWRGVHPGQKVPVAVKVMTAKRARDPKYLLAFSNEVRSVARLHHPGIVMVFDYGEVPSETEEAAQGLLATGCPYLAMELCGGGSLKELDTELSWGLLKGVLLSLLEALAHAHARGVIHRDLKPANILLSTRADQRPGLKISDFGIAAATDRHSGLLKGAGTPRYMAPEQIVRRWRDQGPWTDLYALGCLAYELATGAPPFPSRDPKVVLEAHLVSPPRPLEPLMPVPRDFEAWIRRLLKKSPGSRYRRAADAAWDLIRMDASSANVLTTAPKVTASAPARAITTTFARPSVSREALTDQLTPLSTMDPGATSQDAAQRDDDTVVDGIGPYRVMTEELEELAPDPSIHLVRGFREFDRGATSAEGGGAEGGEQSVPPLPPTWRQPQPPAPSMQLVGAGLGLFGLRTVPLVDRDEARDAVWEALEEVTRTGSARLVSMLGPAGVGKSRLVEWITQRAHEVGGATILKAVHTAQAGPAEGLGHMLATHLRCVGMSHHETVERLERLLRQQGVREPYEWRSLAEIITPAPVGEQSDTSRLVYFQSPSARYAVLRRMMERLARERPVVLWLDDAQWGSDALGLAQDILDADTGEESAFPVLILLTVQREALAERPLETHLVELVQRSSRASALEIDPLAPADRKELVRVLLRLQGDLVDRVADRTGGNPLFAVQLVGDWVQRGVLEVGRDGFVLSAGGPLALPDDLHSVWGTRVDRVVEALAPGSREALEVAAALGLRVDRWEWHVACVESAAVAEALQAAPEGTVLADVTQLLLGRLVALNLVTPGGADGTFTFVHGMLRESIERVAREAGRWRPHNAACAAMLGKCYPLGGRGHAERLGRHFVAAGDWAAAIDPLLEGAMARREASEFGAAQELLELREEALTEAGTAREDERWGAGWVLRCRLHEDQNQLDEALRWAGRAEGGARDHHWEPVLADALAVTGTITSRRGQQDIATDSFERARALYELHENLRGVAECLRGLGTAAALSGDFERAGKLLRKALASFERQQMLFEVAHCMRALGNLAWTSGKPTRAGAWWDQTLAMCDSIGDRLGVGLSLNGLAEVARVEDKLDVALHLYTQAIAILKSVDSGWTYYRSTLAMIQLARGEFHEARHLLEEIATITRQQGQLGYLGCANAALLACCGGLQDWDAWDRHYETARLLLQQTSMIEPDVAWAAQQAGDHAAAAGQPERARQAYRLASLQYMALSKGKDVRRIARKLSDLRTPGDGERG